MKDVRVSSWPVQDAKARFCKRLDASVEKGAQIVTRRGIEMAVLVPIEECRRLRSAAPPSFKTLLLAPQPRFERLIPKRRKLRRRDPHRNGIFTSLRISLELI